MWPLSEKELSFLTLSTTVTQFWICIQEKQKVTLTPLIVMLTQKCVPLESVGVNMHETLVVSSGIMMLI